MIYKQSKLAAICVILGTVLSGCDPLYGGVSNHYSETIKAELYTDSPTKPYEAVSMPSGRTLLYRKPTKLLKVVTKTLDGKKIEYDTSYINKKVLEAGVRNEQISWALTPNGLLPECIQHLLKNECKK